MKDLNGKEYPNLIPIKIMQESKQHKDDRLTFIRANYPLRLAFSTTVHFAQGSTTNRLIVWCGSGFNRNSELL